LPYTIAENDAKSKGKSNLDMLIKYYHLYCSSQPFSG
jgi:hypothetical protein